MLRARLRNPIVATQFAARVALIAFASVTLRGVIELADFQMTMFSALSVAAVFFGLGLVIGELARRTVEEIAHREFEELTATRQTPDGPTLKEA